jgi:hypothetical protein
VLGIFRDRSGERGVDRSRLPCATYYGFAVCRAVTAITFLTIPGDQRARDFVMAVTAVGSPLPYRRSVLARESEMSPGVFLLAVGLMLSMTGIFSAANYALLDWILLRPAKRGL